jgi:beta-lactamase class D
MRLLALALAFGLVDSPDLSRHFVGINGTFVLLDGQTGKYIRYNPGRAGQRYPPCSTFKIPNTAIALESGVAPDPDYTLRYDPALKQQGAWARDHSLRSAFATSAVWYYQEMARRVGANRMTELVRQFAYGNKDISGGIDRFWLGNSLRISADEQVRFLKRFYERRLGLSESTTRLTKEIMVAEEGAGWRLSAKTGACPASADEVAMWYVGYVEKGNEVFYFALQLGDREYGDLFSQRIPKAKAILTELGILR